MSKYLEIFTIVLLMSAFGVSIYYANQERNTESINEIEINIEHADSLRFITEGMVQQWLNTDSIKVKYENYGDCDISGIEKSIGASPYIGNIRIYKDLRKVLTIDIQQENMLMRLISDAGNDYYVTEKGALISPVNDFAVNVPIITLGDSILTEIKKNEKKYNKNYYFLENLINFVKLVEIDPFWKNMIVQINLNEQEEIELIPRVGSHKIVLCDSENLDAGKDLIPKLRGFYKNIFSSKGWSYYKLINLKYDNIVVATKFD